MTTPDSTEQLREVVPLAARLFTAIGLPTHVLFLVALLYTSWLARIPNLGELVIVLGIWGLLGLYWLFRLVAYLTCRPKGKRSGMLRWIVAPVIVALSVYLVWNELPLRIAFHYSRSGFDELVRAAIDGKRVTRPQWIGCYYVTEVKEDEGNIVVLVDPDHGFLSPTQAVGIIPLSVYGGRPAPHLNLVAGGGGTGGIHTGRHDSIRVHSRLPTLPVSSAA